jgi:ketosteroid isomerase-like protein
MAQEENIERLRAVYAEWAKGNLRAGEELFAEDVAYTPQTPDETATLVGPDAIEDYLRRFLSQWDEFRMDAEDFTDLGEAVLVTERQHAIGKSSRVETEQTFYSVWTFRDGLVVSVRWDPDRARALEAAGISE